MAAPHDTFRARRLHLLRRHDASRRAASPTPPTASSTTARDNAIVFPTWFVGTHADLEWMIGDGKPLDTSRYFVVVPSMFANGLSSSPSNTPAPYDRGAVPGDHHPGQCARPAPARHRAPSGSPAIELAIGGSMGAFQAYQWGLATPTWCAGSCRPAALARVSRHCHVFLEGVKAALLPIRPMRAATTTLRRTPG